jgi:ABC-type polysaccharide/polyol phosphate export permease
LVKQFCTDIRKYFLYSIISACSQLKAEVANSYLNWFWWVLEPLCFMLIYTFMFGYVFKAREPYFPVFIFVGISMWDFFNRMVKTSVKIIKSNKPIISKVYLPKFILILTKIWVNGFKMAVSFLIVLIMMGIYSVPLSLNIIYFCPIILFFGVFTFGCCVHLLHYGVFIEDLSNVVNICLRLLFYMTGIFYNVETRMPYPYGSILSKWNPLAFFLQSMRGAILYGKTPYRKFLILWLVVGIILSWSGIRKIYKNENSYVKVI